MPRKARRHHMIQRTLARVSRDAARLDAAAERWSWIRLALFVGGILASGAAYFASGPALMWGALLVFMIAFWAAVLIHQRLEVRIRRWRAWIGWQKRQLARMTLDWDNLKTVDLTLPQTHPFAHDLDLIGDHSLLRLIDTAVTTEGRARLLAWLTAPETSLAETRSRQSVVMEIAPRHRLRAMLALEASLNQGARGWTTAQVQEALRPGAADRTLWIWALGAALLAWLTLALLVLNLSGRLPPYWAFSLGLHVLLLFLGQRVVGDMFQNALTLESALRPLNAIFGLLERWSYARTPALAVIAAPFLDSVHRPSRVVGRVMRVVNLTGVRGNPVIWLLLNALVPYDFLVALRFNAVRREIAAHLPGWLERWFALEALSSLANLAYINPQYTYPEIRSIESTAAPFAGRALGHPLFHDAQKVANDFTIQKLGTVAIITGSNMSGKSSFLKTLGINLALAYAGGPVDAAALSVVPMRLFASMRISDSVTDGISFFYAEVKRLKALLDALERSDGPPLFFLIDEIFRGTNNRERLSGARSYTRALVGKRGAGLISTHDLELTRLSGESPAITNYHFRETVSAGQMLFDYTLHPGPCPTTNALKIMELEGLPVETTEAHETSSPVGVAAG